MSYPDQLNPDLLDRIPLDARLVIDFGCGGGALGAEFKRRNPAARFIGVERDEAALRLATQRLDGVFAVDIDRDFDKILEEIGPGRADCLVFGDVLEHLRDPWSVLARAVGLLSERGLVVICMPNAEHWSFVERLMRGTWDYEDQGLFDSTHLRWFTAETVRRALRRAGLVPVDFIPRTFDTPPADAFIEALSPSLTRLGIDRDAYWKRATPIQHVWRATRGPVPAKLPIVSTMLSPLGGVSQLRVIEPMRALASDPSWETEVIGSGDQAPDGPGIFIFHRPLLAGESGLHRLRQIMAQGWLVVCEFDDHPAFIPVLQRPDVFNFLAVHAVQTSTEPLAQVLGQQNPEVVVFPNAVARLPLPVNFQSRERVTFFFAGLNRDSDWPPYVAALNAVIARTGDRIHFHIVNDRGLFDALATPAKTFTPLCDYETYLYHLGHSEISFMPLLDSDFNRCKSDLKFIEAAAHRVVALASPVVYESVIEDGVTGMIFRDEAELATKLLYLVNDIGACQRIAEAARAYVTRHRMLGAQLAERSAWYRSLWERRADLHASLLRRVPQLAVHHPNLARVEA